MMAETLYKSSWRALGKEACSRPSLVLQKKIPEVGIPMLGKKDKSITTINTLRIHA
jgi:hypothetical protein